MDNIIRKGIFLSFIFPLLLQSGKMFALNMKGKVVDINNGEEIIGAIIKEERMTGNGEASGLDGTFSINVTHYPCTLICSSMGYQTLKYVIKDDKQKVLPRIQPSSATQLHEITVLATNKGNSETGARKLEMHSTNVINVMSAKAIELSPDITVANVIQRMSGVTVERNSSGEGQYAILRGMDKRYNYTLVNGIKIPSPDNKNRFVPLDLFPSEILSRIEVNKSLTAGLEGDGIGGAVNLVMKDAPASRMLTANIATGYNALYISTPFLSFDTRSLSGMSPDEIKGNIGSNKVSAD